MGKTWNVLIAVTAVTVLTMFGAADVARAENLYCATTIDYHKENASGGYDFINDVLASGGNQGTMSCSGSANAPLHQTISGSPADDPGLTVDSDDPGGIDSDGSSYTFSLSGTAEGQVSGSPGSLHSLSSEHATDSPAAYFFADDAGDEHADGNPIGNSSGGAAMPLYVENTVSFTDSLTFINPTGDPISVLETLALSAAVNSSQCLPGGLATSPGDTASAALAGGLELPGAFISNLSTHEDACAPGKGVPSESANLVFPSDSTGLLGAQLATVTSITWGAESLGSGKAGFQQNPSALADASNTGNIYIDVLTPGAYYVDDSHAIDSFATPSATSPEPDSMLLFGTALAGLGILLRRRGVIGRRKAPAGNW